MVFGGKSYVKSPPLHEHRGEQSNSTTCLPVVLRSPEGNADWKTARDAGTYTYLSASKRTIDSNITSSASSNVKEKECSNVRSSPRLNTTSGNALK